MHTDETGGGVIVLIMFVSYFLPALVASVRHHRQRLAIGILNLCLGWTLIGWVIALVWACTMDVEARPIGNDIKVEPQDSRQMDLPPSGFRRR